MAENQIINKVVDYSNTYSQTLLDLTQDTVNRSNLERNQTAHNKEGEKITGALAIEDAEAWARGTRNGEPVTSEDETYHNNSKWYSTVSGSIMQITGQMAQAAATSATSSSQAAVISGSYMNIAGQNAEEALDHAREAQSYARGDAVDDQGNPYRPGQDTDNAMYYKELAEKAAAQAGALDMTGATANTDGTHGLIKQPHAGDQDKFFRGDGNWADLPVFRGVNGSIASIGGMLPPAPPDGEDLVFKGNGTWGTGGNDTLIAPVEKSNTATNAYAVGEQFVLNGVLCKAKTAISVGDTFVFDTNYQYAADITSQIKAIVDAYVTGVKGNSETNYRHGNANLTLANIAADPLGVANGGTGLTSAPSMKTNLGSTTAASPFEASPRPGVTGALPIANGGTGKTTAADARSALGLGGAATYGATSSVASGGTSLVTSGGVYSFFSGFLDILKFGSYVNIKSYNSSSKKYTVPHFGVIIIRSGSHANLSGSVGNVDVHVTNTKSGYVNGAVTFVCKGNTVYCGDSVDACYYIPITM